MNTRSHIVHFSTKSRKSDSSSEFRPLPVLIKDIQTICIDELEGKLLNMLNTADDRLFDMAENSYNNAQFDAMRLLRIKREGLTTSFKQELLNNFKQTLGKIVDSDYDSDNVEELSFENIALVKDDDLEEDIATDAMVNKAKTSNQNALEHIRIRMDTIISDKSIDQANNPLEPAYICDAFRVAAQTLDLDIASLLVIYKLFDRSVISQLESLYQKINQFFIDKGILPELKVGPIRNRATATNKQPKAQDIIDSLPINETDEFSESTIAQKAAPPVNQAEVLGIIQQLLSDTRAVKRTNSSSMYSDTQSQIPQLDDVSGDNRPFNTQQLLRALSNIQVKQAPIASEAEQVQPINLRDYLGAQLPNTNYVGGEERLGRFNEDMIDIVSMLFDFILEDENLKPQIKSIIARLQIPMLKVSLVDKSFLSNRRHPARVLLNELARAGLSWDEKDRSAQAMFDKILAIAERIMQEFSEDVSLFSELLQDFLAFKEQNQQRAKIFERRTREAEVGKARSESARSTVNKTLTAVCKGRAVPEVVKAILKKVWSHAMLLERLKDNEESWKRRVKVAQLLVWSVQPISTAEELEKLISKVPILVKSLRKGMDLISYSPIESSHLLEQLETYHRELIKGVKDSINQQDAEEILRLPAIDVTLDTLVSDDIIEPPFVSENSTSATAIESPVNETVIEDTVIKDTVIKDIVIEDIGFSQQETGEVQKQLSDEPIHIDSNISQTVEQLRAGSWVELKIEGEFKRCKLAARITTTGKYIFVNRNGMKMAEFLTDELCQYLQLGNMKIFDDEALFDRALESVISNLRSMKAQA